MEILTDNNKITWTKNKVLIVGSDDNAKLYLLKKY